MNTPNKLVREWLDTAENDLKYAQVGFKETALYANICFSCQQAFEKYLKAFLTANNLRFPKTHDLTKLLTLCINLDSEFNEFSEAASVMAPYSSVTRYPDMGELKFSKQQADQALGFVIQLKHFIEDKLSL